MANNIFKIAITIFIISLAVFITAIFSWLDIFTEALEHPVYNSILGDIVRAILKFSDIFGWYAFIIGAISGCTSWFTFNGKKPAR